MYTSYIVGCYRWNVWLGVGVTVGRWGGGGGTDF